MTQDAIFDHIAKALTQLQQKERVPLRVAINGIEGTGKTKFAEGLTQFLKQRGKNALQVSIDGFHFNKAHRYRQGKDSAQGYYEDSYNEGAFVEKVLLAAREVPPRITMAIHDLETDEYLEMAPLPIATNSILITDGAYLFKPVYRLHWDYKIYLKTDFETALERGAMRDAVLLGGIEQARAKFQARYHQASRMYLAAHEPEVIADLVIDNTDFEALKLLKV